LLLSVILRRNVAISLSSFKTITTDAICLRTYDYAEADKIVHFYSATHGRITGIAKGVKKTGSKLSGACQPMSVSRIQVTDQSGLQRLCQYSPLENFPDTRNNLLKLSCGMLFLELVYLTQDNIDSETIYHLLLDHLKQQEGAGTEVLTLSTGLVFQVALLQEMGIKPALKQCILTGEVLPDQPYYCFSPQLGGVTTPDRKNTCQDSTVNPEWVYISWSTCQLFSLPPSVEHLTHMTAKEQLKAQRFLQYYVQTTCEKRISSYDLLLNLLE
jgi:DNA repair protein RecO (recombination protein O)